MPVSADPQDLINVSLATDKDKPEETRPTFQFRFVTSMENRQASRLTVEHDTETDPDKRAELLDKAVRISLVGWKNMKFRGVDVPFDTPVFKFLTDSELMELVELSFSAPRLAEADRKKLSSQSTTSPEKSARDAETPVSA